MVSALGPFRPQAVERRLRRAEIPYLSQTAVASSSQNAYDCPAHGRQQQSILAMSLSQPPAPPGGPNPAANANPIVAATPQASKPASSTVAAAPKPWQPSMQHGSHNSTTGPAFHQFSASTEEIIKRVSANASARAGTPGYQAAREQVLQKIVTSDKFPPSSPMAGGRGRGRGGGKSGTPTGSRSEVGGDTTTPGATSTPLSGRGRGGGRGRGRGGGRGGKRKRADSDDSEVSTLR